MPCFREALRLDPTLAAAHQALGLTLLDQGERDAATASLRQAVALQPQQARAHTNLGQALHKGGDADGAAACFREAVRLKPDYAIPHNNLGALLNEKADFVQALPLLRRAVELKPDYPEAHYNLGNALRGLGDPAASRAYREAVRLKPDYARAHVFLGVALTGEGRHEEAMPALQTAIRLDPKMVEAHEHLGHALLQQSRWEAALPVFETVLALQPDHQEAFACAVRVRELLCDWTTREADFERLRRDVRGRLQAGRRPALTPFNAMTMPWPAAEHLAVARAFSDDLSKSVASLRASLDFRASEKAPVPFSDAGPPRLRIGYIGGTFHDHALMHLMQGLFALHDRRGFEVFVYSYGPEDDSRYRRRLKADCDHFRDLAGLSVEDCARRIHADGVHILVDLMGHTGMAREEVVALRPAPVQVNWIGFAGSMGAGFLDYLITDRTVTPPEMADGYSERLVWMPHCYLINDHGQEIAAAAPKRVEFGLPPDGFVFTCFNNSYKFEPRIFDSWMRILAQTPDSVLWLYSGGPTVERNLRREAAARGVAASRLVFAPHRPKARHLARLRLADLFLDTHYVNAHTGASDALWAGLPVLTCPGGTFASRVAASLLANVGLPELVAADLAEYERKAVGLATDADALRELRKRLAGNRTTWPLFDTPRFTRDLECAYRAMWDLHAAGGGPRTIEVAGTD